MHTDARRSRRAVLVVRVAKEEKVEMCANPDLVVCKVSRKTADGRIEFFKVMLPVFGGYGVPMEMGRENLIRDINAGKSIVTVVRQGSIWAMGSDVRVTTAGYLRTDANDATEDNLGKLPEYERPFA